MNYHLSVIYLQGCHNEGLVHVGLQPTDPEGSLAAHGIRSALLFLQKHASLASFDSGRCQTPQGQQTEQAEQVSNSPILQRNEKEKNAKTCGKDRKTKTNTH